MATLDSGFEGKLREAVLDNVEQQVRAEIGPAFKQMAADRWQEYARAQGYDIEHIWQDAELFVERSTDAVTFRVEWPGLTALFEFGVSPHTIDGNPVLAFHWAAPPEGTRPEGAPGFVVAESVDWGSVTGGIDGSRAIRDSIREVRRLLEG